MTTLTLANLSIARGKQRLCSPLNLTIAPGDFWGILGPNGCGKSTLLQTLCGQLPPAQGQLLLNGQALHTINTRAIAQQMGILFQDTHFTFPQTIRDYCADARFPHQPLLRRHSHEPAQVLQALAALRLTTLADKNIQHLSGGEQRRAAIAALLVQAPAIYLLDEPANHLDVPHQMLVMRLLRAISQDQAVVMSLHDINLAARYCNKILLFLPDGGTLHGSSTDLLTSEHLSRVYQYPIDAISDSDQTYWQPRHEPLPHLS